MNRQEIVEELREQNTWWETNNVDLPNKIITRDLKHQISDELSTKKITGIVGLRRVGKTTLLKLIIRDLLKENESTRICYFSFDLAEDISPRDLIKIYSEEILKEPYSKYSKKVFFLFDEIQKVTNWSNHLKSFQDKNLTMKFIITGSSSLNITKGAGESLAGRIQFYKLPPFSFKEYLRYNEIKTPTISLDDLSYPKNASMFRIHFNDYLQQGGLPELYDQYSTEHLKQILDLIFFRDIVDMFTIKKTDVLKGLFHHITDHSGQLINYSNLADALNTQYRTIKDYVQYLQDSFLAIKSPAYETNYLKSLRKNPKMYVSDHAYMRLWKAKEGLKAQTIAFNHLQQIEKPYFNKDPELDMVLPTQKMAFEIKYTDNITKKDMGNIMHLSDDFTLFLVTKDTYDTIDMQGKTIHLIPLWLLTLAV